MRKGASARNFFHAKRKAQDFLGVLTAELMKSLLLNNCMRIRDIVTELSFMGSQCTKDCSGHRAGYAWSQARGGAPAASASASFNKGAAIAVSQTQSRPQGGGKIKGQLSPTTRAQQRRTVTAMKKTPVQSP